jgi:hypothetical protein
VTGTYDEGVSPSTTLFVDAKNNIGVAAVHYGSKLIWKEKSEH